MDAGHSSTPVRFTRSGVGRLLVAFACFLGAPLLTTSTALAGGGPSETVVLVNTTSEASRRVAAAYVTARDIPRNQVCEVACSDQLTVPIADFVRDVVEPLRRFLRERDLEERCRFLVLTQGMPIRAITQAGPTRGWPVSTAAALALLDTPRCGVLQPRVPNGALHGNPYTSGPAPTGRIANGGRFYLVTALIARTEEDALALIERSRASEDTVTTDAHFVYQDANGNAGVRNAHYDTARAQIERLGFTTEHAAAGADVVKARKRLMGYMGGGSYSKLSVAGIETNEYPPGAIADMLQSFGAVPENFAPNGRGKQFPITHFVKAGITGAHGAVAEPYSLAFPPADLFLPYVKGFTLAETFHQKMPVVYWMNLVLGDPLCAPFARRPIVEFTATPDTDPLHHGPDGDEQGGVPSIRIAVRTRVPDGVSAKVAGVRCFADGALIAWTNGDVLDGHIQQQMVPRGARQILIEAQLDDEAQTVGWAAQTVEFPGGHNGLLVEPTALRPGSPLSAELGSASAPGRDPIVSVTRGGERVPGSVVVDGTRLAFTPTQPWRSGEEIRFEVRDKADAPLTQAFVATVGPDRLTADGPAEVVAGEGFHLSVLAVDAEGAALPKWRGPVEMHSVSPPVRWAVGTPGIEGLARIPLRLVDAGEHQIRLVSTPDGAEVLHPLRVLPAELHHATTPLSLVPQGQQFDVPIVLEDEFGNRVTAWAGTVDMTIPGDADAVLPGAMAVGPKAGGRVTLRDVVLPARGARAVSIHDGDGKQLSQPNEGVRVAPTGVRAWCVTRAAGGALADQAFAADVGEVDGSGVVIGGRVLSRFRSGGDEIRPPHRGAKNGDVVNAVTFLIVKKKTKVRIRAASRGALRVTLDGQELHAGVTRQKNPRRAGDAIATPTLSPGIHVLAVASRRQGDLGFGVHVDDGNGKHPDGLLIAGSSGAPPKRLCASGRVVGKDGKGLADVAITVKDNKGRKHTTATDANGYFGVADLAAGTLTVTPKLAGTRFGPRNVKAKAADAHLTGLEFRQK